MVKHLLPQPPSGGCVLKLGIIYGFRQIAKPAAFGRLCVETEVLDELENGAIQPPSGGCVLKLKNLLMMILSIHQPPSGGCVLKHIQLCPFRSWCLSQPPSGGCVLKLQIHSRAIDLARQPPSGGCVLKPPATATPCASRSSRLRAAVC